MSNNCIAGADDVKLFPQASRSPERDWVKVKGLTRQIREEAERRVLLRTSTDSAIEKVRQLHVLCGIGINSAWLYVMQFFGWREFRNRREIGALAGLTPTPHQSGDLNHERGIDKAGNRHVRALAIEIAWRWLGFQSRANVASSVRPESVPTRMEGSQGLGPVRRKDGEPPDAKIDAASPTGPAREELRRQTRGLTVQAP